MRPFDFQRPRTFESGEGWAVDFLGHQLGVRYRDGSRSLLFDAEFVTGSSSGVLAVRWRPLANWDPPWQSTPLHLSEARDIEARVFAALRALGLEPAYPL